MSRFEKLTVWQKAIDFADRVCAVSARFPSHERFGLVSQVRRAAVSVSSNVAEGSGRSSNADFSRFVEIAYGSLMAVVSQSHIGSRQGFMSKDDFDELCKLGDELSRMLSGLRASLKKKSS